MSEINSVVAIYETHTQAEEAVKELQKFGFDEENVYRRQGLSYRRACRRIL